ncbi:hypothetical protein O0L34_g14759 [Tuta absoluta]|nr:hypothetical protein O0L34_g14759 [Tuta absoluta]
MKTKVNADLQRERDKTTFNIIELTNIIDGGEEKTAERKAREELVFKEGLHDDEVPTEYLSHKEKYERAVRKSCYLFKLIRRLQEEDNASMDNFRAVLGGNLGSAILQDGSPLTLHYVMFIPTLMGQATVEQQAYWIGRAFNLDILGTYAQTELGHGTFIRGLETTATYDANTKEFVLHSPTLTAYKWWPGGLAHTANYCVVMAQLYTKGKCHGIHPFIVQLRDEETHMPLPGIKVGEIGAKLGMNGTNNGFLGFEDVRIPREHMLMKNSKVLEDGTYVNALSSKLTYGTMMFVRVMIVNDMCNYMAKAVTIATRYSAVRRQSQPKPNEPEPQILDYLTQQHKLFVGIASVHAFRLSAEWLWQMYNNVTAELESGDMDRLPELHALSCCLKAISTADAAEIVERCRLACGGHGYMQSSNLPITYGLVTAACTYEGENTVLLLQTARYLVKAWQQAMGGNALTPTVSYIGKVSAGRRSPPWDNTATGVIEGFQRLAAGNALTPTVSYIGKVSAGRRSPPWDNTATGVIEGFQRLAAGNALTPTVSYIGKVSAGRRSPPWDNTATGVIEGFQRLAAGNALTPTVSYIGKVSAGRRSPPWDNTATGVIEGFQRLAAGNALTPTVSYIGKVSAGRRSPPWDNTATGVIEGFQRLAAGNALTPTVSYIGKVSAGRRSPPWDNTATGVIEGFQRLAAGNALTPTVSYIGKVSAGRRSPPWDNTATGVIEGFQRLAAGNALTPTVSYIGKVSAGRRSPPWDNTATGVIEGFQRLAAGKIALCVANIEKREKAGMCYEDAWNMTSVQLASASEAHCRAMLLQCYYEETEKLIETASPALKAVLAQLCDLYVVYWALQRVGDLLRFTSISERDIEKLQNWYEDLLMKLRPNAVGLVDAFDIRDEILHSTLGAYDGRVYERLMAEALKSPLNQQPVNDSFHNHLKPFMQGKL